MNDQVVLITGGARGIGAAAARAVAARGASVALVGLEGEELERTAAACGERAAAFEADVTDRDALTAAVEAAVGRFGGLDAVVANAGIAQAGPVLHADPAAFERVLEVNLLGVYRTISATLPHLVARRGYMLPVASAAAAVWAPGMGAYNTSKAGVEALARTLSMEVEHLGVAVGCAYFSWIDTDMVRGGDAHPASGGARDKLPGPLRKTYSVQQAGAAVADGIAGRARTVCVPGWYRAILATRTLARAIARPEMVRRGAAEASRPVGAGGVAGMRG